MNMALQKIISEKILFGDENPETVMEEIKTGKRPLNWNKPGHPDHKIWVSLLASEQEKDIEKFTYIQKTFLKKKLLTKNEITVLWLVDRVNKLDKEVNRLLSKLLH